MEKNAGVPWRDGWWRSGDEPVFTLKLVLILVAVVLAWSFALLSSQRLVFTDARLGNLSWANACPTCGTVESATVLPDDPERPAGSGPHVYRLILRMADGSVRVVDRSALIVPGTQVRVEGQSVRPLPAASPVPTERQ